MWDYAKAGVDIKKIRKIQSDIGKLILKTHIGPKNKNWNVLSGFGHYAGLLEIGSKVFALHTDGVGTKIIVAQLMKKFDTVGIDCVAMNVNDIICVGATPLGFLDYIALKTANQNLVREILKGLTKGSRESGIAIVGGETAVLPDLLNKKEESAFDLVGTVFGVGQKHRLVFGNKIIPGDLVIGLESDGLHSNGYSLARKVIFPKYKIGYSHPLLERTIGEELLRPTKIYVKPILDMLKRELTSVHGLAHITGGSFSKLPRLNNNVNFNLHNVPPPTGIFKLIQDDGKISYAEMYSTFNMGIGFCIVVSKFAVDKIMNIFDKHKLRYQQIGYITKGTGSVSITVMGKKHVIAC